MGNRSPCEGSSPEGRITTARGAAPAAAAASGTVITWTQPPAGTARIPFTPAYRYEVRRGDEVVATGHLSHERPLQVGEPLKIGRRLGLVRSI